MPEEQLWSKKAEKQFALQPLHDQEHAPRRQAAWKAYCTDRTKAEAAQSRLAAAIAAYQAAHFPEDDDELGMLDLRKGTWAVEVIPQGVSAVLAAAPAMSRADRAALQACVVLLRSDCRIDECEEVHSCVAPVLESAVITTRIYSPASTAAVDVQLRYCNQARAFSVEYHSSVRYALVDAAKDPYNNAHQKSAWIDLYVLTNNDKDPRLIPREMGWMDNPDPRLRLTLQRLNKLRQHLFSGAAAALGGRLSDVELVQLLVVNAGAQWNDLASGGGEAGNNADAGSNEQRQSWKQLSPDGVLISEGGWLEHHVRKMCGTLRPEDANWKVSPLVEEEIQEDILRWAEDNRDDDVSDEIRKRIEEGRFTKEAFIRDGPPTGYYCGDHKDEDSEDEDEYWGA